jgi:alpha-1,2-mannosyltransferase
MAYDSAAVASAVGWAARQEHLRHPTVRAIMPSERCQRTPWHALTDRSRFVSVGLVVSFMLGWLGWFYPYDDLLDRSGTPLGADYAMFYVAGTMVATGSADSLYNQAEHQAHLQTLFPHLDPSFCLPFRYPPIVALLAAPLSCLPYALSFLTFLAVSIAAWAAALAMLSRELSVLRGPHRRWLLWAIIGWPVALETLVGGQASMFALLICTATVCALRQQRTTLAGIVLSLAICKPNVLLLFAVGAIVYRPRLLWGAVPAAAAIIAGMAFCVGWTTLLEYAVLSAELATNDWMVETPFWKVHSLAAWLELLVPGQHRLICAVIGGLLAAILGWRWRLEPNKGSIVVALLLTVNALFNPYTPVYDLSLLLLAGLFAAQFFLVDSPAAAPSGATENSAGVTMAMLYSVLPFIYFGPHVSQAVAKSTGVQLFPLLLLMMAGVATVARRWRRNVFANPGRNSSTLWRA